MQRANTHVALWFIGVTFFGSCLSRVCQEEMRNNYDDSLVMEGCLDNWLCIRVKYANAQIILWILCQISLFDNYVCCAVDHYLKLCSSTIQTTYYNNSQIRFKQLISHIRYAIFQHESFLCCCIHDSFFWCTIRWNKVVKSNVVSQYGLFFSDSVKLIVENIEREPDPWAKMFCRVWGFCTGDCRKNHQPKIWP